jgi:hypothetical protein
MVAGSCGCRVGALDGCMNTVPDPGDQAQPVERSIDRVADDWAAATEGVVRARHPSSAAPEPAAASGVQTGDPLVGLNSVSMGREPLVGWTNPQDAIRGRHQPGR